MRWAILADIHGNVLALEAVIADFGHRAIDRVVNLGDCVSGPLWPGETAELLIRTGWPTLRGNHDRWVAEWPEEKLYPGDRYAWQALNPAQRAWLAALPATLDLGNGVLACHGRPDDDNAYLLENVEAGQLVLAPADQIRARLHRGDARIVLCAHSHVARQVTVDGIMLVNPGSVGQPAYIDPSPPAHVSQSGSPFARYAILDIDGDRVRVEHIAVPYDHRRAAERAIANNSRTFAHFVATGYAPPR